MTMRNGMAQPILGHCTMANVSVHEQLPDSYQQWSQDHWVYRYLLREEIINAVVPMSIP